MISMKKLQEEYYKLMVEKLKKEKEKENIYRVSAQYLELLILYTTLLFFVLAEWYFNSDISFFMLSILLTSSIFSTFSLLLALTSNFLMRVKRKGLEEFFHRVSIVCFFASTFWLLLSLYDMAYVKYGYDSFISLIYFTIISFALVIIAVLIYTRSMIK